MHNPDVAAFFRALGAGTLIGGVPWLIVTVPFGLGFFAYGEIGGGVTVIAMPLVVAGVVTLLAMTVFGLPLTAFLAEHGEECPRRYELAGAVSGFCIPLTVLIATSDISVLAQGFAYLFAANGALAGFAAAASWGRYRQRRATPAAEVDTPNPIHDLLF